MLKPYAMQQKDELIAYLEGRSEEINADIMLKVTDILNNVRLNKDDALKYYTKCFDGIELDDFKVSEAELAAQAALADPDFVVAMQNASHNIEVFHQAQVQSGYRLDKEYGIYLGQRVLPLDSVGIYVPGGRAQYPSSVLMNAIPARIAGVKRIVMITPPSKEGGLHPNIAAAAKIAGVTEIYKIGGAQGIAALAYGTQSIQKVDKIVGPGNIFVATAKKLVFGTVDIDMIAGPSEILVIADKDANPAYVAADLLSQAEHDPMASAILVSDNVEMIEKVNVELAKQVELLPKVDIAKASLQAYGTSILCDDLSQCVEISNQIAPEHLELMIQEPMAYLDQVKHAGSVFLGYYTCESIGDYFGGTNHVLPTSGTARFSSALGVDSFIKKSSFLYYSEEAVKTYGSQIVKMAQEENLDAHANAVKVRLR
ncbi:MAG: histidinol dehydrogenase [Longicatena sp.]|nr:histidinol dehydrogenase [Longicatena sp.]